MSGQLRAANLRIIFVTGDRDWRDRAMVEKVLQRHPPGAWVIQGGAPGADTQAEIVAKEVGHQPITMAALWSFHSKKAGPIRNREMARLLGILRDAGAEIAAYAFHDNLEASKGTKDMTGVLDAMGIRWEHICHTPPAGAPPTEEDRR